MTMLDSNSSKHDMQFAWQPYQQSHWGDNLARSWLGEQLDFR